MRTGAVTLLTSTPGSLHPYQASSAARGTEETLSWPYSGPTVALVFGGQRHKVALAESLPYCWGPSHISPTRSGTVWKLVLKEGRLLVTGTLGRFSRPTAVPWLSDTRISLSGGPQVTSPLRSLRVSGNAPRRVTPKGTTPREGRTQMSPPVGPPLQGTTRRPSVAPVPGLREAPSPTTSCEHQGSEPAPGAGGDPK